MRKLLLTALVLGVCFGCALGDVKCFLAKISNCTFTAGGQTFSTPAPVPDICKNSKTYFDCIREAQKECSTHYDMDGVERIYGRMCKNGTFLNTMFVKHWGCIQNSTQSHLSCYQDIIDFEKKFKVITPEVLFEISKLTCKERHTIYRCMYDFVKTDCGTGAKIFMEILSLPSERVNSRICRDVLRLDEE